MGRLADPGQVLHLVDEVDAVRAGPHQPVRDHLVEVEPEHPQRHRCERAEHEQLEPVGPAPQRRCQRRRRAGLTTTGEVAGGTPATSISARIAARR